MTRPDSSRSESTTFVQLNRRFLSLADKDPREETASRSYLRESHNRGLGWDDLLQRRLVIVLGEPGSGKTEELRQKALSLRAAGQSAFFVRLDELVQTPLASVIGPETSAPLDSWHAVSSPATFFLDSVDESKLQKASDFHVALRRFRDAIGPAVLPRVRIILSSRISEWHPETDGAEVCAMFGLPFRRPAETRKEEKADSSLLVVQIAPLEREQVELFAHSRQIPRVASFLEALDSAHAWEFARRPLDVIALAGMWSEQGKIGTLTELIEFDLDLKLREPRHHSGDLLTATEARAGAEALAAATMFGHSHSIKVPDQALAVPDAADGRAAMPDTFTDDKYHMLLTRPLFDGASYGRIRFHHRRVREYLAAQWVLRRMEQGCSLEELESLFFVHRAGTRIIRASLAPVVPWLCAGTRPWHQAMRRWVLEAAPSLHLRYGDPQALPLPDKQAVLHALLTKTQGRQHAWLNADEDALARLGDAALAPDISRIMLAQDAPRDVREAMLMIVIRCKLSDCADAALQIIAALDEPEILKNYAGIALRDCALPQHKRRWANIVAEATVLPMSVVHMAVDELFPGFLTDQEAIDVLMKARNTRRDVPELPRLLSKKLQSALQPERCGLLLAELIRRLREEPHFLAQRGDLPLSQKFGAYRALLAPVMLTLFRKPQLSDAEVLNASLGMWFIYDMRPDSAMEREDFPAVEVACAKHPAVRRRLLWEKTAAARDDERPARQIWRGVFWENETIMQPADSDTTWLVADISERPDTWDRLLALHLALERWLHSGRPRLLLHQITAATVGRPDLRHELKTFHRSVRFLQTRRWWHSSIRRRVGSKRWWGQHRERLRSFYFKIYNRAYITARLRPLAHGRKDGLLVQILDRAERGQGSYWSSYDWPDFKKSWGRLITRATQAGLKGFWRRHTPLLPHEKPNPNQTSGVVVLGLTGLQLSWEVSELDVANFSDADATLAARYAVNELNDFPPWFPALLAAKPTPAGAVLSECVRGEWKITDDKHERWDVLYRLACSGLELDAGTLRTLLELLAEGDPAHVYPLRQALTALFRSPNLPGAELTRIAARRFVTPLHERSALATWFTTWVQLDPASALDAWESRLLGSPTANNIMVAVCAGLNGRDSGLGPRLPDQSYFTGAILGRMISIVARHVRFAEDLDRANSGGYTPNSRDFAQEFRDSLFRRLADFSEPATADIIARLADEPSLARRRDYLLHLRENLLERLAEAERWRPADVRAFEKDHEVSPYTDCDLFRIGSRRFNDIGRELKHSDSGLRAQLSDKAKERDLRIWLANELTRRRNDRYTVPQEVEIDQQQHPDIRLENPRAGYVSVEVKLASEWSLRSLLERLETQLFGQYLRAHDSRYGFFVLGIIDADHRWDSTTGGKRLTFDEIIKILEARAHELSSRNGDFKTAKTVALDFRRPIKKRV